ncbi:DUF748 domain-containing protein [Oryzomicrobium sp.]|uniref:DUF748 domain-containing protein n=1 Tax=Oryzomicrobium sp. TaxID=1911578 RepID=UPI0025CF75A9|nr:DUF748 domain-containing protein [Oryzomicrobium sp.]MCE1244104.1 DUF748 domain-containing protein [Oryzomicrobium sp.]
MPQQMPPSPPTPPNPQDRAPDLSWASLKARAADLARRRGVRRGAWIVGIAWLVWLAVGFASGPLFKDTVAHLLSEKLLRPVSIARLAINPFTLRVDVEGFRIDSLPDQGDKPILAFDRLMVDLSASTFVRFKPVIADFDLERPEVNLVRFSENRTNISDIIDALRSPPDQEKTPPPKFELRDFHLRGGRITLDDRVAGTTTTLADLDLLLPRLANLGRGEDATQPVLKGVLDGAPFELKAEAVPFAAVPEATVRFAFTGLDPLPLLNYAALPLKVEKARVDLDVNARLRLEKDQPIGLALSGEVALRDFDVRQKGGAPLVAGERLAVTLDKVEPLERSARIAGVRLEKTELHVSRDSQGKINWLALASPPAAKPKAAATDKTVAAPAPAVPAPVAPAKSDKPAAAGDDEFKWSVAKIELSGVSVVVDDSFQGPPRRLTVSDLQVSLRDVAAGFAKPVRFDLSAALQAGDWAQLGTLTVSGGEADLAKQGIAIDKVALDGTKVSLVREKDGRLVTPLPFVADAGADGTPAESHGKASAHAGPAKAAKATTKAAAGGAAPPAWHVQVAQVAVNGAAVDVEDRSAPLPAKLKLNDLSVALAGVDTAPGKAMTVKVGTAVIPGEVAAAAPGKQKGRSLARGKGASLAKAAPDDAAAQADQGSAKAAAPATGAEKAAKQGKTKKGGKAAKGKPAGAGKAGAGDNSDMAPGRLEAEGTVALAPLDVALTVRARQIGLQPVQAYLADKVGFRLAKGQFTGSFKVALAEPKGKVGGALAGRIGGDMTLGDLSAVEAVSGDEFLNWKSLYFGGIDVKLPVTDVAVREVALSDFAARVEVSPKGELNLKQLMKPIAPAKDGGQGSGQATPAKEGGKAAGKPAEDGAKKAGAAPAADGPRISVGKVTLQGGRVFVNDQFVQPNYSARLVDLGGRIGSLSSDPAVRADFDIRGRLGIGTPIVISGKVNPLAKDPFLDLKMEAKGIEMTTFTPYSGKYLGYTIEKGKLLVDVSYLVENRQLKAENHIFLDQFTLGERVESPDAIKLPVRLAISLLTNNRGEIDLRLPVSGSLDDPQFSVGGVIWQIVKNLITKAVTAPFSLLAKAFGGGEDLEQLAFAPGRSSLDDALRGKLDTLLKVLNDRKSLNVEITGIAVSDKEADDYRRAQLERKVKLRKRSSADPDADDVAVSPAEYPALLEKVYKDASFPKPRNLIGLTKTLPVPEMERLLLANTPAGEPELRKLAERRAKAVQDYLVEKGIASERLFLVTPKLEAGSDAGQPRVALSLR